MKQKLKQNQQQKGIFHIYSRGNNRRAIYYNDYHRYRFLKICDKFAKKHDTKILAFVLMQNHYHLVVQTECLSKFMRDLQQCYAHYLNRDQDSIGTVLARYGSALLKSNLRIDRAIRYVLQNPLKTGLVNDPKFYFWSSYAFYFSWITIRKTYDNQVSKKRNLAKLSNYIEVDTEFVEKYYSTKNDFQNTVLNSSTDFKHVEKDDHKDNVKNNMKNNKEKEPDQNSSRRISDADAILAYRELLGGRLKDALMQSEVEKIIYAFRNDYGATAKQISRIMNEPYRFVCKVANCKISRG